MGSAAFESADQESFGGGEKGLFSQSSKLIFVKVFNRRECTRFERCQL